MPKKTKKAAPKRSKAAPKKVAKKVMPKAAPKAKEAKPTVPSFRLRPLGDRIILLEQKDAAGQTASGIFLPESAKDKETKKGRVVAAGPGRTEDGDLIAMTVKPGDLVLYGWGDTVAVDGVEYVIARESEVIAIVNE
jgi:chaperonin GroES